MVQIAAATRDLIYLSLKLQAQEDDYSGFTGGGDDFRHINIDDFANEENLTNEWGDTF
ncbi:hypothetical protein KY289_013316 [Solanum tuberosum]|nr:hypothetical protein KY289_013316 [Solanum tuberosum]